LKFLVADNDGDCNYAGGLRLLACVKTSKLQEIELSSPLVNVVCNKQCNVPFLSFQRLDIF